MHHVIQRVHYVDKRVRERLPAQLRRRLQDEPLSLVVQSEPLDTVSSGHSISNVPEQLQRRPRKLDGYRGGGLLRGRKIAPPPREEETRAGRFLPLVFAGDRQRDRRLACASLTLEPGCVFVAAPVNLAPDLCEDVAARDGETGRSCCLFTASKDALGGYLGSGEIDLAICRWYALEKVS